MKDIKENIFNHLDDILFGRKTYAGACTNDNKESAFTLDSLNKAIEIANSVTKRTSLDDAIADFIVKNNCSTKDITMYMQGDPHDTVVHTFSGSLKVKYSRHIPCSFIALDANVFWNNINKKR